jgi:hypothetical protein
VIGCGRVLLDPDDLKELANVLRHKSWVPIMDNASGDSMVSEYSISEDVCEPC